MTLRLQVDSARWSAHLASVRRTFPDLVPVIKGNGYGFGQDLAAERASALGVDTVAVGVVGEVDDVVARFTGDVVLLEPWDPAYSLPPDRLPGADRLILTASRAAAVRALAAATLATDSATSPVRVLLEGQTAMHRFGLTRDELTTVLADATVTAAVDAGRLRVLGLSLHLPMVRPDVRAVAQWATEWATEWTTDWPSTLWVSHLTADEVATLHRLVPGLDLRHRIGTRLWLGDPIAYTPRSTVLAVHDVAAGTRVGYRQRRAPRATRVLVVSGGTAHGIALTAPSPVATVRQRAVAVGTGALDAFGRALSPFTVGGRRLWFAEPPHAQVSMLWLPESVPVPRVGDPLAVEVRMTTVHFDEVVATGDDRPTAR